MKIVEFRQAITLQNFDKSNHINLLQTDQILQNIVATQQELLNTLEDLFADKYRTKPWIFF